MLKKTVVVVFLLLIPVFTFAQLKSQSNGIDLRTILRYGAKPIGLFSNALLDPNKFSMSQSYSMTMTGFGGNAIGQAVYLNTMSYQISNPLSFKLQWGYLMNQPLGGGEKNAMGFNTGLPFNNGFFISGAQLKYKPWENTELKLEFRQMPYRYNPYYGLGSFYDREF